MYSRIQDRLQKLIQSQQASSLCGGLKGLEKESLRVNPKGKIAQTPHPIKLGAALTNPYITTDYSEALMEFITPPFSDVKDAISFMEALHVYTYQHLDDELLWGTSMPCVVDGEMSIPIAEYGHSNIGQMKHVYRVGLWHRYGRSMQAIAGIHFNYSLPEAFWPVYQQLENDHQPSQTFISQSYLDMTRNLHRYGWLVLYLFGASPAICKSFLTDKSHSFAEFDHGTLFEPYGTSLRMSDIGYKNDSQSNIDVSYNDLQQYVSKLTDATKTSYAGYEKIGVKDDNQQYKQLNTNILQIENEYYSNVRPKQIANTGERPSTALKERGVRYVELRSVDLGAFDPSGTSEQQLYFLEAFMIFCLLADSPDLSTDEKKCVDKNLTLVATAGRTPDLTLHRCHDSVKLKDWGLEICQQMENLCQILDADNSEKPYSSSLQQQMAKLNDPALTPSAQILSMMSFEQLPFFKFALKKSQEHQHYFKNQQLSPERQRFFDEAAKQSIADQQQIEANDTCSFDDFLNDYFSYP
ncbi:MAG: glutamate--cysteine ligase [Piscirickettsiaceae bacterium]|nr:MAG: glutamate--cysteine ligase [Piscirickettsiaceae bacterium]PCI70556.1 MAG: glutamate--cysteine ligase [Piscirickettsiaceae bacterium]